MSATITNVRFLWITDTHCGDSPGVLRGKVALADPQQALRQTLTRARSQLGIPDFIAHTGDVAGGDELPGVAAYMSYRNAVRDAFGDGVHTVAVRGNHDVPAILRAELGLERFRPFGSDPNRINYSFDPASWLRLFVVDQTDGNSPIGKTPEETIAALTRDLGSLRPEQRFGVLLHFCPIAGCVPWQNRNMLDSNGEALHALLRRYAQRCIGVFHGHDHRTGTRARDGVAYHSCASSVLQYDDTPAADHPNEDARSGFAYVNIRDNGTTDIAHR